MQNPKLVDLNFRQLVDYGGQPRTMFRYDAANRPSCSGYCTSCEDRGLSQRGELDLMSHGCDSADFEFLLGPLPCDQPVRTPVLFLLEDPGGEHGNGDAVTFKGFSKKPPNRHYFWTLPNHTWPTSLREFGANFYGPYFAYIMAKHSLANVYITNTVKCGVAGQLRAEKGKRGGRYDAVRSNCQEQFLSREIEAFGPQVVFCFGGRAFDNYKRLSGLIYPPAYQLMHPSYIANRWQTSGRTQEQLLDENDKIIRSAVAG
jgi:hypothetical protein